MRTVIFIFIFSLCNTSIAQLREGFNPDEAKSLIAVCNSYNFINLYGSDSLIIPKNFQKVFTSEAIGLDNMFQVYECEKVGIINFRGSTSKTSSCIENFYSAMIRAEGIIKIDNKDCAYKFAADTAAAVHAGYALAVVLLSPVLIEQINELNTKGIYNILITGHSQGGALAHLSHAYLRNLSECKLSSKNVFKSYAFANPMCGNKAFSKEYAVNYGEMNMSYSIINLADKVPKMPMRFGDEENVFGSLFYKRWANIIEGKPAPKIKDLVMQILEPPLQGQIRLSSYFIEKFVASTYVSIDMPVYINDINYFPTGAIRQLDPFIEPKIPIDTQGMTKAELAKLQQDNNGNYYEKPATFSQHSEYQYYVSILKKYFSMDYNELELLYLPKAIKQNSE